MPQDMNVYEAVRFYIFREGIGPMPIPHTMISNTTIGSKGQMHVVHVLQSLYVIDAYVRIDHGNRGLKSLLLCCVL